MNFLNVDIPVKNVPELDKGFVPLGLFFKNYQKGAAKPLCIAMERSGGQIGTYETKIYGTPEISAAPHDPAAAPAGGQDRKSVV